ncbi:MAG TPA: flagellin [Bryobacteraceae bacterium]|jgi:flagellin|nr:flagellin [Bryobacteraceae bacterium]
MSYSFQTNVTSLVAQQNLRVNSDFQSRTITRLTSGYRINSSGDDAAGLAIANKFRADTTELQQGVRNANDGTSILQIVDGGLNNISNILDRLKTLATQSASDTFSGNRATLNTEFAGLLAEIDRQAANIGLSTGTTGGRFNVSLDVYIGGGDTQTHSKVVINLSGSANQVDTTGLTVNGKSVDTKANALTALTSITSAIAALGLVQGAVGTGENELSYAVQLAQSQISSFSAAQSAIRDADVATEAANLTKAQILEQSSVAALAQANAAPQALLKLLQ